MATSFRIGKTGPTIYEGVVPPTNALGITGDLYIQTGASPQPLFYQKQTYGWFIVSDPSFGFTPQAITTASASLNAATTYGGVNSGQPTTVTLAAGYAGKTVVIKDESGTASTNVITVVGQSGDNIDGQSAWYIDVDYGSLTLVYKATGYGWSIISAITSAVFNQIKL